MTNVLDATKYEKEKENTTPVTFFQPIYRQEKNTTLIASFKLIYRQFWETF